MELKLTAEMIRAHLFNGGFRPFTKSDWHAFADADEGSLIAEIRFGRFEYSVIFSPALGSVQIFTFDEVTLDNWAWEMDLNNGRFIDL